MDNETPLQSKELEFSFAGDLPDRFNHLRHELDRKKVPPVSEIRHYDFSDGAILYAYPSAIRSLLEIYQSDVQNVIVTTHERPDASPSFSIRIYTDTEAVGILEIAPPADPQSESAYVLNQVDSGHNIDRPLSAEEVGRLLISMAVSPSDSADIDQARRSDATVASLDPRDPTIFYLLKHSLDTYANDFSTVARYNLTYDTPYDDTPLDVDLFVTNGSSGVECYDMTARSSYVEDGYASAFTISARCYSGMDYWDNQVAIQGTRTILTEDTNTTEAIDRTAATAYVSTVVEALANSPMKPSKPVRL